MTFREHQDALRASQQHVLDRPDPVPDPPRTQRKLAMWVGGALVIVGAIAILRGCDGASAAERFSDGPHEIVLFLPPPPPLLLDHEANTRQNIFTLSAPYADRETCNRAKLRLVVMVKGGKLVCLPPEKFRVN